MSLELGTCAIIFVLALEQPRNVLEPIAEADWTTRFLAAPSIPLLE